MIFFLQTDQPHQVIVRIALRSIVIVSSIHKKYVLDLSKFSKGHSTKCLSNKIHYMASFLSVGNVETALQVTKRLKMIMATTICSFLSLFPSICSVTALTSP